MQTDSYDDSALPVIPLSSYSNGSQKSPKRILRSTLSEAIRYSPMKIDPEKSSVYHCSISDSYSDDLDALEPFSSVVPLLIEAIGRKYPTRKGLDQRQNAISDSME